MPAASANSVLVNKELQRLGFGDLKDPTLPAQFAVCVRDHDHFRGILMHMPQPERSQWYQAMIPHVRFKAKPLADYEMESRGLADQNQLPHYDPKTLAVTDWKPQEIQTQEFRLAKVAEQAIDRDLREAHATQSCKLVCFRCTYEQSFRVKKRSIMPKVARDHGWTFPARDKALCRACSKTATN